MVCLVSVASVVACDAIGAEPFRDSAGKLDAAIASVASCADPGGAAGQFRLVVYTRGFEHVSAEVHLQWLESDEKATRVAASVVVEELSSGMWSVGTPKAISRDACSFEVPATHTYSSESARFVVAPSGPGQYAFRRWPSR